MNQKRSGYASEIMPERATTGMSGTPVPIATEKGTQRGVIPPARRRYGTAKYESVTAEEAMTRMQKRIAGELPVIKGGLDDRQRPVQSVKKSVAPVEDSPDNTFEDNAFENGQAPETTDGDMVGFEPMPPIPATQPGVRRLGAVPAEHAVSKVESYLSKRQRLTMAMPGGMMSMSVIDVVQSRYSVTILLPAASDAGIFIPTPGSEITLQWGDVSVPCYFPGAQFDLPALGLTGLTFIKKDEG